MGGLGGRASASPRFCLEPDSFLTGVREHVTGVSVWNMPCESNMYLGPFSLRILGVKFVLRIGNWLARRLLIVSTNFLTRVYPSKTPVLGLGNWFLERQDALLASSWVLPRHGPGPVRGWGEREKKNVLMRRRRLLCLLTTYSYGLTVDAPT